MSAKFAKQPCVATVYCASCLSVAFGAFSYKLLHEKITVSFHRNGMTVCKVFIYLFIYLYLYIYLSAYLLIYLYIYIYRVGYHFIIWFHNENILVRQEYSVDIIVIDIIVKSLQKN